MIMDEVYRDLTLGNVLIGAPGILQELACSPESCIHLVIRVLRQARGGGGRDRTVDQGMQGVQRTRQKWMGNVDCLSGKVLYRYIRRRTIINGADGGGK